MKTRGLVMEVHKNTVLVMNRDGRFKRLPKRGRVEVGDDYSYGTAFPRSQLAVAAVLLLALASVFLPLQNQPVTSALVTVDINPSLELAVSSNERVISAQALNDDGAIVLAGLKLKGYSLERALVTILHSAGEHNFLGDEAPLLLITGTPLEGLNDEYTAKLRDTVARSTDQYYSKKPGMTIAVAVITAGDTTRDEAAQMGLSAGKYAVYLEVASKGLPIDAVALQQHGIGPALLDLDMLPSEILKSIEGRRDLIAMAQQVRDMQENKPDAQEPEPDKQDPPQETKPEEEITKPKPNEDTQKPAPPPVDNDEPEDVQEPVTEPEEEVIEEPEEEPEEPIMVADPDDLEPVFEEARRGLWDWFKDFLFIEKQ